MNIKLKVAIKVCVIIFLGGAATYTVYNKTCEGFHNAFSLVYAHITEFWAESLGLPVFSDGPVLYTIDSSVRITSDCNGFIPFVVLVSASLMLSLPWKGRFIVASFLGIMILIFNEVRILTFFLIKTANDRAAGIFHDVISPLFLFVILAGLWLKWLRHELEEHVTDLHNCKNKISRENKLCRWERLSLGLTITLVILLLMDLIFKGTGILPYCQKNGEFVSYIVILCFGLIGWFCVAILLWKRIKTATTIIVGAFTGVHVALLGQLILKPSICNSCVAAAILSILVFITMLANGYKRHLSFSALVIAAGCIQGIYFIGRF